jgi:hypothetical protein
LRLIGIAETCATGLGKMVICPDQATTLGILRLAEIDGKNVS